MAFLLILSRCYLKKRKLINALLGDKITCIVHLAFGFERDGHVFCRSQNYGLKSINIRCTGLRGYELSNSRRTNHKASKKLQIEWSKRKEIT